MWTNKNDQMEQCFVVQDCQQLSQIQEEDHKVQITKKINQHMPANQLRTVHRPENMLPRTFFLDRPLYLLPQVLHFPCQQTVTTIIEGRLKLKIVNSNNLTLQQYFGKKKFKCIYNKLDSYRSDTKTFIGKLKGIDSLIDYNWKSFKQLELQVKSYSNKKQDQIDSDFESGNLCRAYTSIEDDKQYYLLLQNDLNTYGYNNWFHFRVKNKYKGIKRFTIVNMIKKTSFFSQGMLISIFSTAKNKYQQVKWFKGGDKITFSSINFVRNHHQAQFYSCLSFQYDFTYEDDEVYFALNQPYTYSRLVNFIHSTKHQIKNNIQLQIKNICYTISNNILPMLRFKLPINKTNNVILLLARQHPCQTVSSFIVEGIINSLIQNNPISEYLLSNFQIIVVPMVNPDGVIHGSSRCNMAGLDLNRQWGESIIKQLTPQTLKIKQFIMNLTKNKTIKYMIDLHGHGKKLNSFFFSCKGNEKQNYRLLSMSMKKIEPRFNIYGCTYGITKDKQNTIRSKVNRLGIAHSYTLETSLYGWKDANNQIKHYNQIDFQRIGRSLLQSIFLIQADSELALSQLGLTKDMLINEISCMIDIIQKQQKINYDNKDILSDSDPQGDKLDVKELIGKCSSNKLNKKILETLEKPKFKAKKNKNFSKQQSGRFSSKNMRESCPSNLQFAASKISVTNSTFFNQNDCLQKYELRSNSKKVSFSQKWQQKRKGIAQKKKSEQQIKQQNQQSDGFNLTRTSLKSRLKNESSTLIEKKIIPTQPKIPFPKKKIFSHKIKTQFKQMEQYSFLSEQQLKQTEIRKSALELRFKQLKQESLNVLLTDTLSILKILPQKPVQQKVTKPVRNISLKSRNQHIMTEPTIKQYIKMEEPNKKQTEIANKDTIRYKKFKQFLNNGGSSKKMSKKTNSVFYYFPIL